MMVNQVVHTAAGLLRFILKRQKRLHFIERHIEAAAASDKRESIHVHRAVQPIVAA